MKTSPHLARSPGRSGMLGLLVLLVAVGLLVAIVTSLCACVSGRTDVMEAKALAGSLWTAFTTQGSTRCGEPLTVAAAFARVGLDPAGSTTPSRWTVVEGSDRTLTVDCGTRAYGFAGDVFTIGGSGKDVSAVRVKVSYAAEAPRARRDCSIDAGRTWIAC